MKILDPRLLKRYSVVLVSEPNNKGISTHWGEAGDEEFYGGGEYKVLRGDIECTSRERKEGLCDKRDGNGNQIVGKP